MFKCEPKCLDGQSKCLDGEPKCLNGEPKWGNVSAPGARRASFVTRVPCPVSPRWTVAVDMLGKIIWICPLAPGTSADVLIWDGYGPSRT